jgi:hypothetical protein
MLASSFLCQAATYKSSNNQKFILWATSDTHGAKNWDDDISFNGATWSGNMITDEVYRIDYAFIAGDILLMGGDSDDYSDYLNDTCSSILPNRDMSLFWNMPADERIWGFCIGNHEEYNQGCTAAATGLGLDHSKNWYNNEVVMGNSYNYTALRGNLLFIYMGGDRNLPNNYQYSLPRPGDFYWFKNWVEWADKNKVNVIVVTHPSIFNSSNSYGVLHGNTNHDVYYDVDEETWKKCDEHETHKCDFKDPWPGQDVWSECDDYWNLIKNYQNINLWFNGHVHISADERNPPPHEHAGWDTTLGVERHIQKSKYCTFINCCGIFQWGFPYSYSRITIFSENSKEVKFKSFDHLEHSYGNDSGWESSHQDITITGCLKYPFDPNFEPSNNAPNTPEKPIGETNGLTGTEYEYSSKTIDLEEDQIFYLFSWSDGTNTGWLGPYNSGEACYAKHTWEQDGAYIVRVKAKDIHGSESGWSDSLNVVMPKVIVRFNLLDRIFRWIDYFLRCSV